MTTAVALTIDRTIRRKPVGSFFRPTDFEGSRAAVYTTLNRAVARGDIERLRNGVYYKGRKTPYGMTHPRPLDLGMAVAGRGSGPAGLTAAHFLGLTTQMPVVAEVAVPARAPSAPYGVAFVARTARRLAMSLNAHETAVLEVLRLWPRGIEVDKDTFIAVLGDLIDTKKISVERVTRALVEEHVPAARIRWQEQILPRLTP